MAHTPSISAAEAKKRRPASALRGRGMTMVVVLEIWSCRLWLQINTTRA